MKNKILLFIIFAMYICIFSCSEGIKEFEILDEEFLFHIVDFTKHYKVETYLRAFDVGIHFKQPVYKEDIKLGTLKVSIVSECGQNQNIMLSQVKGFYVSDYDDYENNLVNKIYFPTVELDHKQFIQEIDVSIVNSFSVPIGSELVITNFGTQLFFDL